MGFYHRSCLVETIKECHRTFIMFLNPKHQLLPSECVRMKLTLPKTLPSFVSGQMSSISGMLSISISKPAVCMIDEHRIPYSFPGPEYTSPRRNSQRNPPFTVDWASPDAFCLSQTQKHTVICGISCPPTSAPELWTRNSTRCCPNAMRRARMYRGASRCRNRLTPRTWPVGLPYVSLF